MPMNFTNEIWAETGLPYDTMRRSHSTLNWRRRHARIFWGSAFRLELRPV